MRALGLGLKPELPDPAHRAESLWGRYGAAKRVAAGHRTCASAMTQMLISGWLRRQRPKAGNMPRAAM
jgi:hypothetical protein